MILDVYQIIKKVSKDFRCESDHQLGRKELHIKLWQCNHKIITMWDIVLAYSQPQFCILAFNYIRFGLLQRLKYNLLGGGPHVRVLQSKQRQHIGQPMPLQKLVR